MGYTAWISSVAMMAGSILIVQGIQGQTAGQSPASRPPPRTVTAQSYPVEQIQAGELRFTSQCGFCHGRDAAGGETGPDLTRSRLVAQDVRGDRIGPVLRDGRPEKGMPSFKLSDTEMMAIVAFIHSQKIKAESLGGGRRAVDASDLTTGDAAAGSRYFNGAGGCSRCHSASGDLAGVATRYQGLALLRRMLYPSGDPSPQRPRVTVTLPSGESIAAHLAIEDEFTITLEDSEGARQTYEKSAVKFKIEDPMAAHFDQLAKYKDDDMHNLFTYLDSLK